jgi:hypothetical protein
MDDLPVTSQSGNIPDPPVSQSGLSGSMSKESDIGIGMVKSEALPLTEVGKDIELPKEVVAAGVNFHPTVIPIPPKVSQMGVQPIGHNVTASSVTHITLPLTDDQIAAGMKLGVGSSFRWMAEWCVRRLKQLHIAVTAIGGKTVEVKEV